MTQTIPRRHALPKSPASLRDAVTYRDGDTTRSGWITGACCPQGAWHFDILDAEDRGVRVNLPLTALVEITERGAFGRPQRKEAA